MLTKILIGLAVIVGLLLILVALQPSEFRVVRTATISVPPAAAFAQINDFPASNTVEFTFKPEGSQTAVTWTMAGRNSFMSKAVCLVMNMDKMVGGQFEKGLANLKSVTEMAAKTS